MKGENDMKAGWLFVVIFFVMFSMDVQAYNSRLTDEQIEEAIEFGRNHTDLLPLFVSFPMSADSLENLTRWEEESLAKAEEHLVKLEKEAISQPEPSEKKSYLSALLVPLEQEIKWKKEKVEKLRQKLEDAIALRRLWEERQDLEWVEIAVSFDNYFARVDSTIEKHPLSIVIISSPFLAVASLAASYDKLLEVQSEGWRQRFSKALADRITKTLDVMHAKDDYLGFIVLSDTTLAHARLRILDSTFDLVPPKFNGLISGTYYYAFPLSLTSSKTGDNIDLSKKKVELLLFTQEGEQFNCCFDLSKVR